MFAEKCIANNERLGIKRACACAGQPSAGHNSLNMRNDRTARLAALAAALLAVAARAATLPSSQNTVLPSSKEEALATNEAGAGAKAEAGAEAGAKPEQPVNERHPHAVLFGGTCGGTIISPTWILTAGHCTLFTRGKYVLAGTSNSEDGSGVTVSVKRLVIHPRFSVGPYWLNAHDFGIKEVSARFDFLLAELKTPLELNNRTIAAARLDERLALPAGLPVAYAGYGAEHHGETMRHRMHGMELATLGDDACARRLPAYDAHDMLCAKGRPPRYDSACNGDSGSGLVEGGRLVGVASWVEDDARECRNGALVVFSRVGRVRDWIRQVTGV